MVILCINLLFFIRQTIDEEETPANITGDNDSKLCSAELIELKKTTKQEILEAILAKENAENELEKVKAQLEESEDKTVQLENEVSKLKIANANAPNACKIDTDDQKMSMKNEFSELKMELDGLKSNLKPNMNQGNLAL